MAGQFMHSWTNGWQYRLFNSTVFVSLLSPAVAVPMSGSMCSLGGILCSIGAAGGGGGVAGGGGGGVYCIGRHCHMGVGWGGSCCVTRGSCDRLGCVRGLRWVGAGEGGGHRQQQQGLSGHMVLFAASRESSSCLACQGSVPAVTAAAGSLDAA